MREDSPTHFVRFKRKRGVYERGIELVVQVQAALDYVKVRHFLKDKLDRSVTNIVLRIARAETELPSRRWKMYREAWELANEVRVQLDIVAAQQAELDDRLLRASATARKLCEELGRLSAGR